jgi:hypothetical protein
MEQVMTQIAREAEGLDEDNPRQVAGMMRKLFEGTGLELGAGMEEAIRRMEAGEDPDRIEAELGEALEGEDETLFGAAKGGAGKLSTLRRKLSPPVVDRTLHEL